MDRASEVAISQVNGKITRRHTRRKSGRNGDTKGERFSLQGKRWRFSRGLAPQDVESRISRLRELWIDHERFYLSQVFVDPDALAGLPEFVAEEEAKRLLQRQTSADQTTSEGDEASKDGSWPAFGSSGRRGGVITPGSETEWTPLALWIAEQIKKGVKPVPLPPFAELLDSIYRESRVDYRFGHFARLFSGPRESHPQAINDLCWQDAFKLLNRLSEAYPSVPWTMPQHHVDDTAKFHQELAEEAIVTTARVRSQKPPEHIPLIPHPATKRTSRVRYITTHRGKFTCFIDGSPLAKDSGEERLQSTPESKFLGPAQGK